MKPLFLLIAMFTIYSLGFSQNVGISTLNPAFKLDVRMGSINTDSVYRIGTYPVLSVLGTNTLFVGQHAGNHNSGDNNTFSGAFSGHFNTNGFSNAFFGTGSGYNNTDGFANSFFGAYTGFYSTTGSNNSFFGTDVGASNTTGSSNSFFGRGSGILNTTGRANSFFGTFAGYSNSTGNNNSFYGDSTGYQNTTGTDNTFMGKWAGYYNTTGNSNSFFGKSAGFGNNIGYSNSFFGQKAGEINSSGFENSIFGFYSGPDNTSGFENSFFGTVSGFQNTTGSKNSFFGKYAGYGNTTGTSNTAIGFSSFFNTGDLTNATAIGNNARVDCSNCMVLGSVTNVNNAPSGVNVGIGVNSPNAKLSISSYGVELAGTAASTSFRTNAGILGSMANDEMSIANIGFASLNNSSFGITAYRRIPGSDWMSTALLLEYDVDNTPRVNSSFIALSANGNIGIATVHPQARLDVNGATKTNSLIITNGGNPADFLIKNDASGQVSFRKGHGGLGLNYIIAVAGAYPSQSPPQSQGPMIGEIKIFTGNTSPYGWLFCQGQLVLVTDYPILFSVIGTTYGGDGQTNFALPDLRGDVPVGEGTTWSLGEHSN